MSNLNLNKVVLAGRLTSDPELKLTQNGVSVVSISLAVNRRAIVKDNQRVQEADYVNLVAWRKLAEFIAKYFKKGSALCITGSIQSRSWTDESGQKRYATEVVVDEAMFVDSMNNNKSEDPTYVPEAYAAPQFSGDATPNFEEVKTDNDLPF